MDELGVRTETDVLSGRAGSAREHVQVLLSRDDETDGRDPMRAMPSLLSGLDADDRVARLDAAWSLCLLAGDRPEAVDYLADRLADRLEADPDHHEAAHVMGYLQARHPDRVAAALGTADLPTAGEAPDRRVRADGGQQAIAGTGQRLVRTTDGEVRVVQDAGPASPAEPVGPDAGVPVPESAESSPAQRRSARQREALERAQRSEVVGAVLERSSFEEVDLLEPRRDGRYADCYRARAVTDGREEGVTLAVLDSPGDVGAFAADLSPHLVQWSNVPESEYVVSLRDWGRGPRPWLATETTEEPLVAHGRFDVEEALWTGTKLAEAVSFLHRHGVVHAGLDPKNVVYPPAALTGRRAPMLDNVGLMGAFRTHFEPEAYLDPGYAAPEYYDKRFGTVDHATDVYGLGAVLYRLFTGRPPFAGSYRTVRKGVLEAEPTAPSEHAPDLPAEVDHVLEKALAKEKLTRYETATGLLQELRSVAAAAGVETGS